MLLWQVNFTCQKCCLHARLHVEDLSLWFVLEDTVEMQWFSCTHENDKRKRASSQSKEEVWLLCTLNKYVAIQPNLKRYPVSGLNSLQKQMKHSAHDVSSVLFDGSTFPTRQLNYLGAQHLQKHHLNSMTYWKQRCSVQWCSVTLHIGKPNNKLLWVQDHIRGLYDIIFQLLLLVLAENLAILI